MGGYWEKNAWNASINESMGLKANNKVSGVAPLYKYSLCFGGLKQKSPLYPLRPTPECALKILFSLVISRSRKLFGSFFERKGKSSQRTIKSIAYEK